jgi:hypothetical protein
MLIVDCFDTKWPIFQAVMWRSRVEDAAGIVGVGLAGSWAMGLLVLVGPVAGEVSGPSTILGLAVAAITAVLTGKPQQHSQHASQCLALQSSSECSCNCYHSRNVVVSPVAL